MDDPRDVLDATATPVDAPPTTRAVGAQLAVWRDYALEEAPFDAVDGFCREVKMSYDGALLLYDQLVEYLDNRPYARQVERSAKVAEAAGGKLPLGAWTALKQSREQRRRRAWSVAGSAVLLLAALCVPSWSWSGGQTVLAILGPVLLFIVGLQDKRLKWLLYLCPAPIALAVVLGIESWRWWPIPAAIVAFLVVCEGVARRVTPPPPPRQDGEGRHGISHSAYWNEIAGRLLVQKPMIEARNLGSRPIAAEGREVGAEFDVESQEPITPAACSDLERHLNVPIGGVRYFRRRDRAGVGTLSVRWADVLDRSVMVPEHAPRSLSIHRPFRLGRGQDGSVLEVSLLRKHVVVLGGTGSGKTTSVGWSILYAFEHMPDVKCFGIDLRRKNLIAPFRHLFGDRVAYTVADADAMLAEFQSTIDSRVARIADQLEDEDEDDVPDENWIPSKRKDHEQYVLFVDELTSLTPHQKLRARLSMIEETGRQAACTVVLLTPDLDSKKIQDSSVFDQPQVKILMATSFYDVKEMMGPGASASGYGVVAEWERPKDAGKMVISSDEHLTAEVYRADHLTIEEIRGRRRARREAEAAMDQAAPAGENWAVDEPPDIIDAEIVTEDDEMREDALRTALMLCGAREGLPARDASQEMSPEALTALRTAVTAKSVYVAQFGRTVHAYPRSALVNALEGPP